MRSVPGISAHSCQGVWEERFTELCCASQRLLTPSSHTHRSGHSVFFGLQENLVAPRGVRPILHPLMDELFLGMSKEGVYNPSMKLHLLFRKRLGPQ